MKKRMKKINYLFFIILPFIDLITSLSTRFLSLPVSLGIVIKGLYTIFLAIYIILYTKTKSKKKFIFYLIMIIAYCLLFTLTKKHIWNLNTFFSEFISLYKFLFTGYILFAFIILNEDDYNNKYSKIMFYSLMCYVILLLIPELTNTSFNSYMYKDNDGSVGWFYSANEISSIILMLFPFYFSKLKEKIDNKQYWYCLLIIPIIYSIFIIGTKTSWYGLILISLIIAITYIIKERKNKKLLIFALIVPCLLIILNQYSPTKSNLESSINTTSTNIKAKESNKDIEVEEIKKDYGQTSNNEDTIDFKKCGKYYKFKDLVKNEKISKITNVLLSGRESKAYTLLKIYKDANIFDKLFGLGFTNNSDINNCYIIKYIEIDLLDGLVHFGIIGLLIILFPFILLFKSIKLKQIKTSDSNTIIYIMTSLLIIGLSFVSGHIIGYPTCSIYLSILLILIMNQIKNKKECDKNEQ